MWELYLNPWKVVVGKVLTCARWPDQWIKAQWELLQADTNTNSTMEVKASDLMRCALCGTGNVSKYSKTSCRRKSSVRRNSTTLKIPFRLDKPGVSAYAVMQTIYYCFPHRVSDWYSWGDGLGRGLPDPWDPVAWPNRFDCSVAWKVASNRIRA